MTRLRPMFFALTTALATSLTGHSALAEDGDVMLKIDGEQITRAEVKAIWKSIVPGEKSPPFSSLDETVRQNVLRGIVGEHLLYNKAMDSNIDESPQVQEKLEALRKKTVIEAFLDKKAASRVSATDIKQEYEKLKQEASGEQEVRARHILVEDEETALTLLERLEEGDDFADLAKELSTDKASAVAGGDLGYFTKDKMVDNFANAAFALEEGEISDPVQSEFGWHVIKVTDKRAKKIAPFIDKRDEIEKRLRAKALSDYINQLVDSASITYYGPDGEPRELTKTPDTTQ